MQNDWLEYQPVPTAVLDAEGSVVACGPRLGAMVARSLDQLIGRKLTDLYADKVDRHTLQLILDSVLEPTAGPPRQDEFHLPRSDGGTVPVLVSAVRVSGGRTVVTFTDITSLKEAEAGMREHFSYVSQLSDTALEQAIALKRRFQAAEKEADQLRSRESVLRSQAEQLQDQAEELRDHAVELQAVNRELERRFAQRTAELRQANLDAIYMLAVASEAKDQDTGDHVRRIRGLTERTARSMGFVETEAYDIGLAAVLHDVGKIHVPDAILSKPGPLTPEERTVIQQHTLWGQRILPDRPFFARSRAIARSHHENHDGSGYPDALAGNDIPVEARIAHVVDVYDALVSPRVYKKAWPREKAVGELREKAGVMFDPDVVAAFSATVAAGEG